MSHIEQQNKIGNVLSSEVLKLLGEVDKSFQRNLIMVMSQAIRSIAFARDAHVRILNDYAKELAERKTFWNDLTQLTSFSKEGLPVQILSFLGFGSVGAVGDVLSQLGITVAQRPENVSQIAPTALNLQDTLTNTSGTGAISNLSQSFINLSQALTNASQALTNASQTINDTAAPEPLFLTNFIFLGVVGVIVATIVLRVIGHLSVSWKKKDIESLQGRYYKKNFKNDMTESLYNFYVDIEKLTKTYYPTFFPQINEFYEQTPEEVMDYIRNKILPSDNIRWPEWLAQLSETEKKWIRRD